MKFIISDIEQSRVGLATEGTEFFDAHTPMHHCVGCFGCWIKTPGECVIKDAGRDMGKRFAACEELVIISRCIYGGFSPSVKRVLDRSISYIQPDFIIRNGEMHHKPRYANRMIMSAYFYGENITDAEKSTAQHLVSANALNFNGIVERVCFAKDFAEWEGLVI